MAWQLVQRAYKFALEPSESIEEQFRSHAGAARFAFNWGLAQIAAALDAYGAERATGVKPTTKVPGHFELCTQWTRYKDTYAETPDPDGRVLGWVSENSVCVYQAALRDAALAWKNFFASRSGTRAGRRMLRPRFKSKHTARPSFQVHGGSLYLRDRSHINLPKIGLVKIPKRLRFSTDTGGTVRWVQGEHGWVDRNNRIAASLYRALNKPPVSCPPCSGVGQATRLNRDGTSEMVACKTCKGAALAPRARIVRATVSYGASGTWWCSITAEVAMDLPTQPSRRQRTNGIIGLDLGTRYLAVDSEGSIYPNPQPLRAALAELRTAQQTLSRRQPDSRRRARAKARVGAIHERVALLRKSEVDRITTRLARTFGVVAVEGWDAQDVAQRGDADVPVVIRRRRNRQLADAAPGMVRWQLQYKTSWYGAGFFKAAKHQETGRTCSACGVVRDKPVPLTQEEFVCAACGVRLDRRVNSARVVRNLAQGPPPQPGGTADPVPPTEPRGGGVRPEPGSPRQRRPPAKRVTHTPALF